MTDPILERARHLSRSFSFGKKWDIFFFETADSTNDICKAVSNNNFVDPIAVVAEKQTKGRGRMSRKWVSGDPSGLYFSVLWEPKLRTTDLPLYPLAVCLAVVNTIKDISGIEAKIKWPNDVLIDGRKTAGILAEAFNGRLVLGVGLNLNNEDGSFPAEICDSATSLKIGSGISYEKTKVLEHLLDRIEAGLAQLEGGGQEQLIREIVTLSYTVGRQVELQLSSGTMTGKATGLAHDGSLIVESENGKITHISSGEVTDAGKRT